MKFRLLVLLLSISSCGCSLVHITTCTYYNLLSAYGIDYAPPVCPGGQPTQIIKLKP